MRNLRVIGFFAAAIVFTLTGFVSCTEGGSLEVKNAHTAPANVGVWFEDGNITSKNIEPGKTEIWTFSKDGSVYYTWTFEDDYDRDPSAPTPNRRVTVMGGDVTKVTVKR